MTLPATASAADLLRAALDYAARGWPVFPLAPGGKVPLSGSRGFLDATTNETAIRNHWARVPHANIGIVCGPLSFEVLDVDGPEGMATLRALLARFGYVVTLIHRTPRGWHLLFAPCGLPSAAGKIGPGLDTRGSGTGYIVAPPSRVNGFVYRVAVRAELADVPAWLAELARGPKPTPRTLAESVAGVRNAPDGTKNTTVHREAFVAAKDSRSDAEAEKATARLLAASTLPRTEAERAARNGLKAGLEVAVRRRERFRRVPVMLILDPRFQHRSAHAKLVAFYVCAGPDSTAIPGVAVSSLAALAKAASLSEKATRHALRELTFARLLRSDLRAGVFWLPSVTSVFRPELPNVARAWRNALDFSIPRCSLGREIGAAVNRARSTHFATERPIPTPRALKIGAHKEEGSPLLLGEPPESPPKANAPTLVPTQEGGDA